MAAVSSDVELKNGAESTELLDSSDTLNDAEVIDALSRFSEGSMCIGSSTGDIHGLTDRLAAVREEVGISMCFWGAFGK